MTLPPVRPAAADQQWFEQLQSAPSAPFVAVRGLLPTFESPKTARDVTKITLHEWGLCDLYDDASVVVSELVTNAIRHGLCSADGPIRLVLVRHEGHLVCMVTDPCGTGPVVREADFVAETGRGMHVIDAMARAWGWSPLHTGGKAVWASFPVN